MASLKFYFDFLSQPTRAVGLLLEAGKIEHEKCPLKMVEGEHETNEEFIEVNPNKQLPAICDDGFCLAESSAILKYLVRKYKLADHWYPSDIQSQAKIDEYFGWHGSYLRRGGSWLFRTKVIAPKLYHKEPDPQKVKELEEVLKKSKDMFENYYLKDTKFIAGNEISIADLQAVCEFTQFWVCDVDPTEGYPKLAQWMKNVQTALQPGFEEVHAAVYAIRDKGTFKGML